jgi:23S rRNA (adenine2503-C2)-methyltransferase
MRDTSDSPLIFDLDPDALRGLVAAMDMPAYRADQVLEWVYRKGVLDPAAMSNLAGADRDKLAAAIRFGSGRVLRQQTATDGVRKLLVQWDHVQGRDDAGSHADTEDPARQTECVMIPEEREPAHDNPPPCQEGAGGGSRARYDVRHPHPHPSRGLAPHPQRDRGARMPRPAQSVEHESPAHRRTACISSQVGCPVGCRFCASGLGGLDGNLTSGQIVEQVWRLAQLPGVGRISNVVFMGMGEPLANFDAVVAAIRTLTADWGMHISARRITLSTVGLPAQIRRLAQIDLPITLAISLHAPNDAIRRQLIPWAQFVSIDQLVEAGRHYFDRTGREITLEYLLLGQVNDQPQHARELASVARRLRANVNLIRYNEVRGLPYQRPGSDDVHRFQQILRRAHVNTHIRASRGRDIAAACGQLRHEAARVGGDQDP